jgi:predicted nucleic acid-binding protein
MIVIDSSAMVEALVGRDASDDLLDALHTSVHAPHLLDVEVLSVLRELTLGGKLKPEAAEAAQADYFGLTIVRYEVHGLADRLWELRHNFNTYDACYLVLAEVLDAPLYTCDRKLGGDGHSADVRVLPRSH